MKIILAPDSFKNSLSSLNVCKSIEKSILKIRPEATIISIPVSDGGEGFVNILSNHLKMEMIAKNITGPLGEKTIAEYGICENTAYIELAQTSGIQLLNQKDKNPYKTTTYGFGELILDAINKGIRKFILGIGGSATNDGGSGMAQALKFEFYDKSGHKIKDKMNGDLIGNCSEIKSSKIEKILKQCQFLVACDVSNPLLGKTGAVYTYAKQKGANEEDLPILENNMANLNRLFFSDLNMNVQHAPGSGASGGLGGGLLAFLNAKLVSGSELILDTLDFEDRIKNADLIITGEGKMDFQTLHGKIVSEIVKKAKQNKIPIYGICGILENSDQYLNDFEKVTQLINFSNVKETMKNPEKYIELAVKELF